MGSQVFRVTYQLLAVVDNRRKWFKAPPSRGRTATQRGSPLKVIYFRFQNLLLSGLTLEAYVTASNGASDIVLFILYNKS